MVGELLDSQAIGQTFTPNYNGLYRIDLYTATYARRNTHPVIFRIKTTPDTGQDLVRGELAPDEISNTGPTVITFPPLPDTAEQPLYFSIESPGSVPGDAITLYYHEKNVYPDGTMHLNGQAVSGDLAFIAYSEETFAFSEIWGDFISRAGQDRSFFAFYVILLLVLLAAFVASVLPRGEAERG
jgi:hypothetical protein